MKKCVWLVIVLIGLYTSVWGFSITGSAGGRNVTISVTGTWLGAYAAGTTYATGDIVSSGGTNYKSLADSNTGNTPASSPTKWQAVLVKGDTGAAGSAGTQGATGAAGAKGDKGDTGSAGAAGAAGAAGTAATIAFRNMSTLTSGSSASVQNVGTSTVADLIFKVPRGATGAGITAGPPYEVFFGGTNAGTNADCIAGAYGPTPLSGYSGYCNNGNLFEHAIAPVGVHISFAGTLTNGKLCSFATGGTISCNTDAAATPSVITVTNEATDTTCFPLFTTAATGDLGPKTLASFTMNSNTGLVGVAALTTPGQITSTLATGTAPLVVASTTNVANLNCSSLGGATFAAPGSIGGTTPPPVITSVAQTYTSITSTSTATGNLNLDGISASNYEYSNNTTAATYTPVVTSAPAANFVRYITLTLNPTKASGVITLTATNIIWIGTAGAAATTTLKASTYACIVKSDSKLYCSITAEAY